MIGPNTNYPGLPLGLEAPVMTPNGVNFLFFTNYVCDYYESFEQAVLLNGALQVRVVPWAARTWRKSPAVESMRSASRREAPSSSCSSCVQTATSQVACHQLHSLAGSWLAVVWHSVWMQPQSRIHYSHCRSHVCSIAAHAQTKICCCAGHLWLNSSQVGEMKRANISRHIWCRNRSYMPNMFIHVLWHSLYWMHTTWLSNQIIWRISSYGAALPNLFQTVWPLPVSARLK